MRTNWKLIVLTWIISVMILPSALEAQQHDVTQAPATQASDEPSISQWAQKILDAYSKLDRYKVHKTITIKQTMGAVVEHDKIILDMAVDRTAKQIALKADEFQLVGKDNTLRAMLIPDRGTFVHLDQVNPLDPTVIQKNWPMFPLLLWVPDLSLYMGTDVQLFFKNDQFKMLDHDENTPENQEQFEAKLGNIRLLLTLDTNTNLIRHATLITIGKAAQGQDVTTTMDFEMDYTLPQKWEDKVFDIDTTNSKPVASLAQMLQHARSSDTLQGKDAPPIVLQDLDGKTIDLSKIKSRVILLDFWATWCGPCIRAMPHMVELKNWIDDNKLDVTVLTINVKEEKQVVKTFIKERGWILPVLMDIEGKVSKNYQASSIPQTVIIVDGKIERIFQGFSPRVADSWRELISKALGVTP